MPQYFISIKVNKVNNESRESADFTEPADHKALSMAFTGREYNMTQLFPLDWGERSEVLDAFIHCSTTVHSCTQSRSTEEHDPVQDQPSPSWG